MAGSHTAARYARRVLSVRRSLNEAGAADSLNLRALYTLTMAYKKRLSAAFIGLLAVACAFAGRTFGAELGSPNTLAYYDPALVKTMNAYGPLFSQSIPHASTGSATTGDFVENVEAPDGSDVRVLVKAPAPAQPAKILNVSPLTAGTTANVYFADAIQSAISGGFAAVVFPRAVYNFVAPAPSGASHVLIKGAKDLVIDGQGSTLNFASPLSAGVTIYNSQRIIFKRFDIDWPNQTMASLGTIVSVDKKSNPPTMRVQIAPQYRVDANTQIIALSPWDAKTDPGNPHFALRNFQKEQYNTNRNTRFVGNNTFEGPYWNDNIAVGDVMLVRHFGWSPWRNAIQTGGSYDVDFENVNVYASPYLAFALSGGGGYRLYHCSVTRRDASRLISSAADAVHVADNTGDLIIEDSTFSYQGDDGLNIHGAVGGSAQPGQTFLRWTVGGEGAYSPYGWVANDPIGFFDGAFGFYGTTSFRSVSHPPTGLQLNFAAATPRGASQLGDLSRVSARYVIRNNTFSYNRARGILLESSLGIIENNTFIGQTAQAIVVGALSGSEGPGVQNTIFRGNHFSNVGSLRTSPLPPQASSEAVLVAVQGANAPSPHPVFENLIFDGNTFDDLQGPGLVLSAANDVVLTNNHLVNTNLFRGLVNRFGTANSAGSVVVTQAHNVVFLKNATQGATTGPISIDTTSTAGIRR
jgi:parallel beta-helix repeat protein